MNRLEKIELLSVIGIAIVTIAGFIFDVTSAATAYWIIILPISIGEIFFIPGYFISKIFFPRRDDLPWQNRLALSIGINLAIIPGLLLSLYLLRILLLPWVIQIAILLIIIGSYSGSFLRHRLISQVERLDVGGLQVKSWLPMIPAKWNGLLLSASLITGATILIASMSTPIQNTNTEFYVDSSEDLVKENAENAYQIMKFQLAVTSHEDEVCLFTIIGKLDGDAVFLSNTISLSPGQTWKESAVIRIPKNENPQKIEFLLNKFGGVWPYRTLVWWFTQ